MPAIGQPLEGAGSYSLSLSVHLAPSPSTCLSHLSIVRSIYPPIYLPTYLSVYLPLSIYLFLVYLFFHPPNNPIYIYLLRCLSLSLLYLPTHLPIHRSTFLFFQLSVYLSCLSTFLSHPFFCLSLSVYLHYLSIYLSIYLYAYLSLSSFLSLSLSF